MYHTWKSEKNWCNETALGIFIIFTWMKMFQMRSSEKRSPFSLSELKCSPSGAPSISSMTMYNLSSARGIGYCKALKSHYTFIRNVCPTKMTIPIF